MSDPDPAAIAARLYLTSPLAPGVTVPLDERQAHYLRHVLRLGSGDLIGVFNGIDGEYRAVLTASGKRGAVLELQTLTRPQAAEPDLWLLFAPIKRQPIDLIAEKATELGVSALQPVLTQRTVVARVNTERLTLIAREAAEQSERLTVPRILEPLPLYEAIRSLGSDRLLFVCDERGTGRPIAEALADAPRGRAAALLIGPEGGFAPGELDAVLKLPFAIAVGLGARVLRADTAALAALAVFQAIAGDWRRT